MFTFTFRAGFKTFERNLDSHRFQLAIALKKNHGFIIVKYPLPIAIFYFQISYLLVPFNFSYIDCRRNHWKKFCQLYVGLWFLFWWWGIHVYDSKPVLQNVRCVNVCSSGFRLQLFRLVCASRRFVCGEFWNSKQLYRFGLEEPLWCCSFRYLYDFWIHFFTFLAERSFESFTPNSINKGKILSFYCDASNHQRSNNTSSPASSNTATKSQIFIPNIERLLF